MDYFVVGDIHGCFFTLQALLQKWDREREHLILVGDLIDRGLHSPHVVAYCQELQAAQHQVTILKGNHEYEFCVFSDLGDHPSWLRQGGTSTVEAFRTANISIKDTAAWFKLLPLSFETPQLLITHAGVSGTIHTYDETHEDSVLWNRKPLVNIGKLQIHGHTPLKTDTPCFDPESSSLNIDTGAAYGFGLTAAKIHADGTILQIFHTSTDSRDIA